MPVNFASFPSSVTVSRAFLTVTDILSQEKTATIKVAADEEVLHVTIGFVATIIGVVGRRHVRVAVSRNYDSFFIDLDDL